MANPRLTGAIIGLGNIGFGFNADRKRRGVWTHERAYAASGVVDLIAAADPDERMRARFSKARPDVAVYADAREMLARHKPGFVSICTPTRLHLPLAEQAVGACASAVFCEKPIASDLDEARRLVRMCKEKGVALAVNHTRRWDPEFVRAAGLVKAGKIGRVTSICARYPAQVYNVGTHLIDALRFVTGLDPETACGFAHGGAANDPDVSGSLAMTGGVHCALSCHGAPRDMVFELDVIGSEGRLRVVENGFKTIVERFAPSKRYGGYRELSPAKAPALKKQDRFVAAVRDLAACAGKSGKQPACGGADGYWALAAARALLDSASRGGAPIAIEPLKI